MLKNLVFDRGKWKTDGGKKRERKEKFTKIDRLRIAADENIYQKKLYRLFYKNREEKKMKLVSYIRTRRKELVYPCFV